MTWRVGKRERKEGWRDRGERTKTAPPPPQEAPNEPAEAFCGARCTCGDGTRSPPMSANTQGAASGRDDVDDKPRGEVQQLMVHSEFATGGTVSSTKR